VVTYLLVQIWKEASDDRFSKFVPAMLAKTFEYLQAADSHLYNDTKLMQLAVLQLQCIQFAVGVDPQTIDHCFKDINLRQSLEKVIHTYFYVI
jgi:hypothetical protein